MPAELTDKQKTALERFKKLKVGALFMRQGTGKTRVALELVNYNKPDYLLYVAPVSTIENARTEIEKWSCCCPYDIIGYETIASSNKRYVDIHDKVEKLKKDGKKTFIIADESIFIKNGKSKRTFRAKELRKFFDYALILNGTPLTRNEWDLFNQMDFLSNRILNMNYREFIKMFFVEHEHNGQRYHTFYEPNRPALVKLCAPYVYEADLDFENEEHSYMRWVICSQTAYKEAKERVLKAYGDYSIDSLLTLFSELQRIAANMPAKNEAVAEYIRERQCICFCNYRDEIEQIQELCECYVITGETTLKKRKEIIKKFKENGNRPLLIMLGCGSFGLNLQFCNEIVYSSINFDYAKMEQSQYRIKRMGQESDISYRYILADTGINRMMLKNLDKKESLLDIIKRLIEESAEKEV